MKPMTSDPGSDRRATLVEADRTASIEALDAKLVAMGYTAEQRIETIKIRASGQDKVHRGYLLQYEEDLGDTGRFRTRNLKIEDVALILGRVQEGAGLAALAEELGPRFGSRGDPELDRLAHAIRFIRSHLVPLLLCSGVNVTLDTPASVVWDLSVTHLRKAG